MQYKNITLIMISTLVCGACMPLSPFDSIGRGGLSPVYNNTGADTVDVLLLFGDSNGGGVGNVVDIDEKWLSTFAENAWRYNSTGGGESPQTWEQMIPGTNTGELSNMVDNGKFGVETIIAGLYWMAFNRPLYVIKTTFSGWCVCGTPPYSGSFWEGYSGGTGYANLISPTNAGLVKLNTTFGITNYRLHTVWIVGVNDATQVDATEGFSEKMAATLADQQVDTENFTSMHFVKIGTAQAVDSGRKATINAAIESICATDARYTPVSGDVPLLADGIHFSANGTVALGKALFTSIFYE